MSELGRVATRALLEPWLERLIAHDCYATEARIDDLIAANRTLGRELAELQIKHDELTGYYTHALHTIDRLREGKPRTEVERDVAALHRIFRRGNR
jgi:thiamine monophosphate kinase